MGMILEILLYRLWSIFFLILYSAYIFWKIEIKFFVQLKSPMTIYVCVSILSDGDIFL